MSSITFDNNENKWFGTYIESPYTGIGAVVKFDDVNWEIHRSDSSGLLHGTICSTLIDKYSNKWFVTNYGLSVYNETGVTFNQISQKFNYNFTSVFPNPADDYINIKVRNSISLNKILVYNIQGILMFEREFYSSDFQTDIRDLSKGVYFVHIQSNNENQIFKLIKN